MEFRTLTPVELLGPLNGVEEKHAPEALFVRGDTEILRTGPRVSIVGSRKASGDGLKRAARLARIVSERGGVVISGLADGIDTAAHTQAIESNGRTVAIIGTPLDKSYPTKNARLQERIATEHLLISQFPVGMPTKPQNFPIRNRTMALISDVTVIIEATDDSGSLHQGWEALRLGRGLFIAKSMAEDASLRWPGELMEYGAKLLSDETVDELFEVLPSRIAREFDAVPF